MNTVDYEVRDGVALLTINRPEARNAFTLDMVDQWAAHVERASEADEVRVLVLTGAPGAFCAGGDMGTIAEATENPWVAKNALTKHIHHVAYAMEAFDKPTIAVINGVAVGAGMDMSLMCDLRYIAASARMSEGYVRLGVVPGDGGAHYLPRIVGESKALELLLTGAFVDAEEAKRIGLVTDVFPDDELFEGAMAVARSLADGPPLALRMIKRAVRHARGNDLRSSLDLISSHLGLAFVTEDAKEALAAMRERRAPSFVGR